MQTGAPYRDGDLGDTSTPLARTHLGPWLLALNIAGVLAAIFPLLMVGHFAGMGALRTGRALYLCDVALPLFVTLMGRRLVRGEKSPPLVMPLVSMLPVVIASIVTWLYVRGRDASSFVSVDSHIRVDALSAECTFAWTMAAFNFALASLAIAGFFATIDRAKIVGEKRALSRFAFGLALASLVGSGLFAANSLPMNLSWKGGVANLIASAIWQIPALTFFLVLLIPTMFAAALAHRLGLVALRSEDATERRAARDAIVAGALGAMGAFAFLVIAELLLAEGLFESTPAASWERAYVEVAALDALAVLVAWTPAIRLVLLEKNSGFGVRRWMRVVTVGALVVSFLASAHVARFTRGIDASAALYVNPCSPQTTRTLHARSHARF